MIFNGFTIEEKLKIATEAWEYTFKNNPLNADDYEELTQMQVDRANELIEKYKNGELNQEERIRDFQIFGPTGYEEIQKLTIQVKEKIFYIWLIDKTSERKPNRKRGVTLEDLSEHFNSLYFNNNSSFSNPESVLTTLRESFEKSLNNILSRVGR